MKVFEAGRGSPLVLVPGLQGRWEYQRSTVDALARHVRVITFSFCDEPCAEAPFDRSRPMNSYGDQVAAALDIVRLPAAAICGVSFGGLVALNFASRYRDRTTALILASTPGPRMKLRRRYEMYTRAPWIFGPVFLVETSVLARTELKRSLPAVGDRLSLARTMLSAFASSPISLTRMASRARLIGAYDTAAASAHVEARTLVVTGERPLDQLVDVDDSSEYAHLISGAQWTVLERTGHMGTVTRCEAFAEIVNGFLN